MTPEHHYKKIDLENGYIEATRDDTAELQNLRVNAYLKDGTLIKSARYLYNIQYDYIRHQEWKYEILYQDEIGNSRRYGHLQYENSVGEMGPDWDNPYPDNFEPVKPEGADMFRKEGLFCGFYCIELNVYAYAGLYIWDELDEWRKPETTLISWSEITKGWIDKYREEELEAIKKFSPVLARMERLKQIQENTNLLRCEYSDKDYRKQVLENHPEILEFEIPLDSRFID